MGHRRAAAGFVSHCVESFAVSLQSLDGRVAKLLATGHLHLSLLFCSHTARRLILFFCSLLCFCHCVALRCVVCGSLRLLGDCDVESACTGHFHLPLLFSAVILHNSSFYLFAYCFAVGFVSHCFELYAAVCGRSAAVTSSLPATSHLHLLPVLPAVILQNSWYVCSSCCCGFCYDVKSGDTGRYMVAPLTECT